LLHVKDKSDVERVWGGEGRRGEVGWVEVYRRWRY
jgi:hypothetical protein